MEKTLKLPIIDLVAADRLSTAKTIRQACVECGFFYIVNHGVEENLLQKVLEGGKAFFALPIEEKMKLVRKEYRGYTPLYDENLDPSSSSRGDSKEGFYIGPLEDATSPVHLNQWPSDVCHSEILPGWRSTMEDYYKKVLFVGQRLVSLIALSLNVEENFFHDLGAFSPPNALLRLLHYPGDVGPLNEEIFGASAHSDFGMITLLATDGAGGLQVCREKFKKPCLWEDVEHVARSTLHRVMRRGEERYSVALFLDPNPDCVVECLKSCCSESYPPRFPSIRSGEYLQERFRLTYGL